jgi:DNA primase
MTIIELIQEDGLFTKPVGATGGGEYAGPCPWCAGNDRFRCWPSQGKSGKYWCRQCGRSGDAIQYLRDYRKMTFLEACQYLGREPHLISLTGGRQAMPAWEPRTCASPGDLWQEKARNLVDDAAYHLWTPTGKAALDLLMAKGLTQDTVKKFSIGWITKDRWDAAPAWGLPETLKENGKRKRLWFPKGITIPLCQGERVLRVRIRRPDGEPRYYILRGSNSQAMVLGDAQHVVVVVESELDAMLLYQEAGDLVNVVSLGNAQARPDRAAAGLLNQSQLILVALDADPAGAKEAWRWWKDHYLQAHRWPPIQGKDPGEMWAAGVDLRAWVQAGMVEYQYGGASHARP